MIKLEFDPLFRPLEINIDVVLVVTDQRVAQRDHVTRLTRVRESSVRPAFQRPAENCCVQGVDGDGHGWTWVINMK